MSKRQFPIRNRTTARTRELKEAIVASFGLSQGDATDRLRGFSASDWKSVLWWLDISGMAIYFLDRMRQLGQEHLLPSAIAEGLVERFQRNRVRMKALQQEAITFAGWFEGGCVSYALLKGMTLVPYSVPDVALRCQTDLDFLVASQNVNLVVHYIHRLGYRLKATSGNTMEFRAGDVSMPDLANLYSVHTQRALEVHVAPEGTEQFNLLARRVYRAFEGANVDTLSEADILVQQALHLLKHLRGEHTRLSWVLELWRHVNARSRDGEYWRKVQAAADDEPNGNLAMGMAFWVAEELFGTTEFQRPVPWQTQSVPPRIRLWLERYLRELLLSDSMGSKLYALLRDEVPCRLEEPKSTHAILFPLFLPARVTVPRPHESLISRMKRYIIEADFFFRRLRFHLVEGLRFAIEAARWRKITARCAP